MSKLYRYQKITDEFTTYALRLPVDADKQPVGTELCEIAGITYVSLPDGFDLPEQPTQISAELITPDAVLIAEIKASSPHVALINERVAKRIAERYSLQDEIKLLRTAPTAEFELYNAYAEECRDIGRAEKAALGL